MWDQKAISQALLKISSELLQWILPQADEGNFDKDELASAVFDKSPDKRPVFSLFEEDTQKKLAVMNKTKTCQIILWLSSNLQKWIYQEAMEGRFDQDEVFKLLKRERTDEEEVLTLNIHPGW